MPHGWQLEQLCGAASAGMSNDLLVQKCWPYLSLAQVLGRLRALA
jgi:hypothetical protein